MQQERDMMIRWQHNQMQHYAELIKQNESSSGARALMLQQPQQHRSPLGWTVDSAPADIVQRSLQQMMQSEQSRAVQQGTLLAQAEKELISRLLTARNNPSGLLGQQVYSLPHRAVGQQVASGMSPDFLGPFEDQEASSVYPPAISQQIVDEHISRNISRRLMDTLKSQNSIRLSAFGSPFASSSYEQRSTADLLQNIINQCCVPAGRPNQFETLTSEAIRAALDSQALASMHKGESSNNGKEC